MKRVLVLLLTVFMLCSLLACGKKNPSDNVATGGNAGGSQQQQIVEGFENAADNYEQGKD